MVGQFAERPLVTNAYGARSVYPTSPGATLGIRSGAQTPFSGRAMAGGRMPDATAEAGEVESAASIGGNPMLAWASMLVLLVALMWGAKRLGVDDDFKNLKLSVYNILVIGLAGIIGFTFWKIVFTKIKVPGLSPLVLAA